MSTSARLDSISATLASLFRQSTEYQRRQAVLAACVIAVAQTGLQGDAVTAALALLRRENGDWQAVRQKIGEISERLDEQYLHLYDLAEQQMTPEALYRFRQARAAAALAFGLSPKSEELLEAVYEAIVASEKQAEVLQAAEMALRAS